METQPTLAITAAATADINAPQKPPATDDEKPVAGTAGDLTTRPAKTAFVAQVVTAQLSGTALPYSPGTIAPPERTLRPYDTPMLPADKLPEPAVGLAGPPDNAKAANPEDAANPASTL